MSGKEQRQALGRGLKALFPGATSAPAATAQPPGTAPAPSGLPEGQIYQIPIERIVPQPGQPRRVLDDAALEELARSVAQDGIIQPLVLRRRGESYEIVAGERRWRAAVKAGLARVPALVRELSDRDAFELALVENIQRADLTPLEEAQAYRRLQDEFALTQEQVAQRVGKDRSTVANAVRLLALPRELFAHLDTGALTAGHARALLGLDSADEMRAAAAQVLARGLSVRQAEALVRARQRRAGRGGAAARAETASVEQRDLLERLQRQLGTKVTLAQRRGRGQLQVHFFSSAELERIIDLLLATPAGR